MIKFGQIFKSVTGKNTNQVDSILGIESEAELVIGHKLELKKFQSPLVEETGNIFRISSPSVDSLNNRIDSHLNRMRRILNKV